MDVLLLLSTSLSGNEICVQYAKRTPQPTPPHGATLGDRPLFDSGRHAEIYSASVLMDYWPSIRFSSLCLTDLLPFCKFMRPQIYIYGFHLSTKSPISVVILRRKGVHFYISDHLIRLSHV
jgi:hypothetical protein